MRSHKPFTNATFTKRVDHEGGRHRQSRAMSEPGICKQCGSVYVNRRWRAVETTTNKKKQPLDSRLTVCPACKQAKSGEPRGFVYIDGAFFVGHREEIHNLVLNEAKRAGEDNPLARILKLEESHGHKLTVATTTEHLAQRLGHAVERAFGGEAHYNFSHENKIARVSWRRP